MTGRIIAALVAALIIVFLAAHLLILALLAAAATPVVFYRLRLGKRAAGRNRTRTMWWRARLGLRPGPGFTTFADLLIRWSRARAALGHGKHSRPGTRRWERLTSHPAGYSVPLGRAQLRKRVYGSLEDLTLVCGPPRGGKSAAVASRIIDNPGPVLATSTRADLHKQTWRLRARNGPVAVFNPQGVGDVKSTFRWDPVAGCDDAEVACRRAASFVGKRYEGDGDMAFWKSKAMIALAAMLHAAALLDATIVDVFSWICKDGDELAERVLFNDPRASGSLRSAVLEMRRTGSKMADSIRGTASEALAWVGVPALAEAATPGPGEGFDVAEFVRANGTVYMIGGGEQSPIAPLFCAFAEYVHYSAGLIGSTAEHGRLDPPLLMALDEVTQICPVPLNSWAGDSGGKGIMLLAVAHSRAQLESRWGQHGAATIWDCCGVKVLLGGMTDPKTLDAVGALYGQIPVKDRDGQFRPAPVLPAGLLHQLPDSRAIIVRRNMAPVIVSLPKVWRRRDVRKAARRGLTPAPAAAARVVHDDDPVMAPTVDLPVAGPDLAGLAGNGHRPHGGSDDNH